MSKDAFERRVRMRAAISGKLYSRTETDTELLERVRALLGQKIAPKPPADETVDQLAARYGLQRRIVEDAS